MKRDERVGKLFLIDGHSLIFRMYYAFLRRPMINSKGRDTSILFGFTKYLLEMVARENPTHIAVAFDPPSETFRHKIYPDYKANGSETPELVRSSLEPLIGLLEAMEIPVLITPGYEADDVISTIAVRGAAKGFDVYMVTPDKDFGQVISDHIWQYKPGKSGNENEIIGKEEICAKYGISDPKQVIDILTIWGDSSDNIKGVYGIGEVGAKKLISQYGSIENILEHIDELTPKQRRGFEESADHLRMSRFLVTIKTDVEVEVNEEDLRWSACFNEKVRELFNEYEFNSLKSLLAEESCGQETPEIATISFEEVTPEEFEKHISGRVALRSGKRIILSNGNYCCTLPPESPITKRILGNNTIDKIGFNLKNTMLTLIEHDISLEGELFDIELMHYLLNPERTHKLEILVQGYLNVSLDSPLPSNARQDQPLPDLFSAHEAEESVNGLLDIEAERRLMREAVAVWQLYDIIAKEMDEESLWDLYRRIDMPLMEVLAHMEYNGVRIDTEQLRSYSKELSSELATIEEEARILADEPQLNVASPKQVGVVIFEKLALDPKAKKRKNDNWPTDEETLMELVHKHPFVEKVLEYRSLRKLISTYLDPLPSLVNPATGRIHTTFNQALTATGRLSSVRPNLQNIPIRTERGQKIRMAFVPSSDEGYILSADYSQIELRIMAELSGDPRLIESFLHGNDIHTATAAAIFHVSPEEVTKEHRRQAKVANFGIIYGISSFGLSQRLGIPRNEAKNFITKYFNTYPGVRRYMDKCIADAREKGYVTTIFGRRRYLPAITSRNHVVRGLAERNAINTPVQGSAADIIKLSMINVFRKMKSEGLKSKMVLQVHDELVFDVIPSELNRLCDIVKQEMESVIKLSIPLTTECSYGKNWLEAQ
ncbi:MAG TPA: DNA polymerase I [Bacteroidales bacterium]|nr:DNA polymerase I [Bacteroidales bacterium]